MMRVCGLLLVLCWPLICAGQEQVDSQKQDISPILHRGSSGDRVRELQSKLNKVLGGVESNPIPLPKGTIVTQARGPGFQVGDNHLLPSCVRTVILPNGPRLLIRGNWLPMSRDEEKVVHEIPEGRLWTLEKYEEALDLDGQITAPMADAIKLPARPLKVDGLYADHTYAAVYLFQRKEFLPASGDVDAVTLDRLKPLIPSNFILASLMNWVESDGESDAVEVKNETAMWAIMLILVGAFGTYQIARGLANSTRFLSRWLLTPTSSPWFTALRENKVFVRMAQMAPALFIYVAGTIVFPAPDLKEEDPFPYVNVFQEWHTGTRQVALAYMALVVTMTALAFIDACHTVYTKNQPENNPIDGILRFAKRVAVVVGFVLICSALAGRSPTFFIGGIGAFMAVIMLVFKDAILGLAASVQIIGHNMVKVGDWIEMPKFGVDGNVESMSLTTIVVRNFDKTTASIPTYAVLSDSFKNWRGMQEAGGRRIKRSILIDMNTVKPCDSEMCDRFEGIDLIRDYIERKRQELKEHLLSHDVGLSPVNGRWLTNIGTFRVYVEAYLRWHPKIDPELTCLVRHLPPDSDGLPMEIYCFCTETSLADYEKVQADVFDHLLSVLPEFDLRVFQNPREFDYEHVEQVYKHRIDESAFSAANGYVVPTRLNDLKKLVAQQNRHLASNPRTRVDAAVRKIQEEVERNGLGESVQIQVKNRRISIDSD